MFEEDSHVAIPLGSAEVRLRIPQVLWTVLLAYLRFPDSDPAP
jgi:hypothetical protein